MVIFSAAFAGAVADFETAAVIVLFLVLLPILNASADFLSIGVTRKFLRHVTRKRTATPLILGGLFIDLCFAGFCLILLLGSMCFALDFWGWISPTTVPLDWRTYLSDLKNDPWQGVALYLMVFTTLLPTLIHIVVGVGGIFAHKNRKMRNVAGRLEQGISGQETFSGIEAEDMMRSIRHATFWGYGLSLILFLSLASSAVWFWKLVS